MRIPLAGQISTKDGASNKNSRLYNVLAETRKDGKVVACVRPGLNVVATGSGAGNGIVCFNGEIVTLTGTDLTAGITVTPGTTSFVKHDDVFPKPVRMFVKNGGTWYAFLNLQEYDHATIGGIWYSSNLITWSEITSTRGYELWGQALIVGTDIKLAAYHWTYDEDEDIYVADTKHTITITSGGSVSIASSSDTYNFYPLLYSGGTYYGLAHNPPGTDLFATSSDLNSVTLGDAVPNKHGSNYWQMHEGGGKFWFSSGTLSPDTVFSTYSTDGLTWSTANTITTAGAYKYSAYGLGKYVVLVYPDLIYYTDDGVTYSSAVVTDAPSNLTNKFIVYNDVSEKFYYISGFVNPTPAFFMSESTDLENWTDITPAGGDQISVNGYGQYSSALIIGVSKGTAFPYDYGVYEVSQTAETSTLTNLDTLPSAGVDFALLP